MTPFAYELFLSGSGALSSVSQLVVPAYHVVAIGGVTKPIKYDLEALSGDDIDLLIDPFRPSESTSWPNPGASYTLTVRKGRKLKAEAGALPVSDAITFRIGRDADLGPGTYDFDVQVLYDDGTKKTPVHGKLKILRDQSR